MSIRVFYSWQSDTGGVANHYLIRDALLAALHQTAESYDLQERPLLDHDTKGVPGTPPIFSTILSKIDQCSIFVADVSFIGQTSEGRSTPNPNVLIELGYAMKAVGPERYLLVMNEKYGTAKGNLPFDLGHLRWPIRYTLDPTESAEKIGKIKAQLTAQLAQAIQVVFDSGVLDNDPSTPTTLSADRALFSEFLQEFPSSGRTAYFLRNHDIGDSFEKDDLGELDHFLRYWNDARHEFFDKELERHRQVLYETLRRFHSDLARRVHVTRADRFSIGMEDGEMRPQMFDLQERLNELATEAYQRHQDLVRAGRRILGHTPGGELSA